MPRLKGKRKVSAACLARWAKTPSVEDNQCRPPRDESRKRLRPTSQKTSPVDLQRSRSSSLDDDDDDDDEDNDPMDKDYLPLNEDSSDNESVEENAERDDDENDDEYGDDDFEEEDGGGARFTIDMNQLFVGSVGSLITLSKLFNSVCVCIGTGHWVPIRQSTRGRGGSLHMKWKCRNCQNSFVYDSDPTREARRKLVAASMCAGISHAKYRRFGNATGLELYRLKTFNKIGRDIVTPIEQTLQSRIRENRDVLRQRPDENLGSSKRAVICVDMAWQIRRQSPSGTATIKEVTAKNDPHPGMILAYKHVSHYALPGEVPFEGSSKSMEGFAISEMLDELVEDDIIIQKIVQDGDSTSRRRVHDLLPEVVIKNCSRHVARNLRRNLERAAGQRSFTITEREDLAARYPEVADWNSVPDCSCIRRHSRGCGCLSDDFINHHLMSSYYSVIDEVGNDPHEFRQRMLNYVFGHVRGNHFHCLFHDIHVCGCIVPCEDEEECPNLREYGEVHPPSLTCEFHLKKLQLEVFKVVSRCEEYLEPDLGGAITSNSVESTNSRFIEFRSKTHPLQGTQYQIHTDLALLDVDLGDRLHVSPLEVTEHYVYKLWDKLGWSISNAQHRRLRQDLLLRKNGSVYRKNYRDSRKKYAAKVRKLERDRARAGHSASRGNTYGSRNPP